MQKEFCLLSTVRRHIVMTSGVNSGKVDVARVPDLRNYKLNDHSIALFHVGCQIFPSFKHNGCIISILWPQISHDLKYVAGSSYLIGGLQLII